jgi:hypothetical protein
MGTTKDIREAVVAELEFDPLVDDADIHVVTINGDVALNGSVLSYPQYLEAAAAAQRVAGVRNVHNHLQVVLPDEDYLDDAMLTTVANNALAVNVMVPDGVEATARGGKLTLTTSISPADQAQAGRAPPHRGRRRPGVRWIVHGLLFYAAGCTTEFRVLIPAERGMFHRS